MMDARMLYLHALSPVHTGTGQAVDVIDLPVAREIATNWPYIPGSSIKGVLRARCEPDNPESSEYKRFIEAFGLPPKEENEGAGSLLFADARLLCLPVRSLYGTFAWVTSPLAIERFRRDHLVAGLPVPPSTTVSKLEEGQIALGSETQIASANMVYLEDLDFMVQQADLAPVATHIASAVFGNDPTWHAHFLARFALVSDTAFSFLAETGTEVTARIQLEDKTKTVKQHMLWYEEAIPAETIFSAPLLAQPRNGRDAAPYYNLVRAGSAGLVQIGGHASVGRGLMTLTLVGEAQ